MPLAFWNEHPGSPSIVVIVFVVVLFAFAVPVALHFPNPSTQRLGDGAVLLTARVLVPDGCTLAGNRARAELRDLAARFGAL